MEPGPPHRSSPPAPEAAREAVSDYAGFDYEGLWRGRSHVTRVEASILRGLLGRGDVRRVVEIGTGAGRLTGLLASIADEYVGLDFDPVLLGKAERIALSTFRGTVRPRVALANLYHLPIAPDTVTAVSLVRVYHHLSDPTAVMSQLADALVPGGSLIVSYSPRPTLGTLTNDVWRAVQSPSKARFVSLTFSRSPIVALPAEPFPTYAAPRSEFVGHLRRAGLRLETERGSGLEEYSKSVPVAAFVGLSTLRPSELLFPSRFALGRKDGPVPTNLPPLARMFACPRCRSPIGEFSLEGDKAPGCGSCGWRGGRVAGFADFRYVPPSASVHSEKAPTAPPATAGA